MIEFGQALIQAVPSIVRIFGILYVYVYKYTYIYIYIYIYMYTYVYILYLQGKPLGLSYSNRIIIEIGFKSQVTLI